MLGNQKSHCDMYIQESAVLKCDKLQIIIILLKFVNDVHFGINWKGCASIF